MIPVTVDDLAANGLLAETDPQVCWQRSVETLTARKDEIEGLAVASGERIEAFILLGGTWGSASSAAGLTEWPKVLAFGASPRTTIAVWKPIVQPSFMAGYGWIYGWQQGYKWT